MLVESEVKETIRFSDVPFAGVFKKDNEYWIKGNSGGFSYGTNIESGEIIGGVLPENEVLYYPNAKLLIPHLR